ncbi:uncharacterized protein LOC133298495 [Gastrolobium bilobum]|uniref:uncharacterized protein LOC133298495 n=1 Tax=Gastrolobium bilobum TaxID=150636 RepID=UPI002AAF9938|nr:uncharacterized protein LOC133298495 [Gastrolobium bilobum]
MKSLTKIVAKNQISAINAEEPVVCDICAEGHLTVNFLLAQPSEVNYMGNSQRNNYQGNNNTGWRNNSGLSYNTQPQHPVPSSSYSALEKLVETMASTTNAFIQETRLTFKTQEPSIKNQEALIQNLETQIGQLAKQLNERTPGIMPSDTVVNPREYCNAITTQSGKDEETKEEDTKKEETPNYDDVTYFGGAINRNKKTTNKPPSGFSQPDPYAKAPYPLRLKQDKEKQQYSKFMEMFKKLQINIPFSEALENMPLYAKLMKGLLSNRHKLREMETIALTKESSDVIKKGLPSKVKDPGRFSIPCTIENVKVGRALYDLGASVNLMPLSFARSLGITEMKSTLMSLQFADRSIKRPEGVLEDVFVKVNDYIFPADFVVLNMEEDDNMPLILGRPFLATSRTLIDVEK